MTLARRHHPNPVREQWERAERWYARLTNAISTKEPYVDDYALVVLHHCWSMHDWLVKALHQPTQRAAAENLYTQADVEQLFQSPELRACRMLANAAKHLDLDSRMKAGSYDGIVLREYDPTDGSRLVALAAGKHDLLELCTTCMQQVRAFLHCEGT